MITFLLSLVLLSLVWLVGLRAAPDSFPVLRPARDVARFRLTGSVGNDREQQPFTLEFDAEGRFRADYSRGLVRDTCFDGHVVRERDPAGRVHESFGWGRDAGLLTHGLLCGNWRGTLAKWRTSIVEEHGDSRTLRLVPGDRPFEALLTVDPQTGHLLRASFSILGQEQVLVFEGWRDSALGGFAEVVRYEVAGRSLVEYRLQALEEGPVDGGFDLEPEEPEGVELSAEVDDDLELRVLPSGHAFVRVSIDEEEPSWFLFDTGATDTVLDDAVARRLGFDPVVDGGTATGAGGNAGFRMGRVGQLRVGPLRIGRALVAVADLSGLGRTFGIELAGILGANVLVHTAWIYDLSAPRIAVLREERIAELDLAWMPARWTEGHLVVSAGFEAHEGWFVLDTGGGSVPVTFHHPTIVRFDLLRDRPTRPMAASGVGGATTVRSGTIGDFVFAGRNHGQVGALFGEDEGIWSDPYVDGLVGIWLLRKGLAILDYPRDRVGFVPH